MLIRPEMLLQERGALRRIVGADDDEAELWNLNFHRQNHSRRGFVTNLKERRMVRRGPWPTELTCDSVELPPGLPSLPRPASWRPPPGLGHPPHMQGAE